MKASRHVIVIFCIIWCSAGFGAPKHTVKELTDKKLLLEFKRTQDSLRNNLINYLDSLQAYSEAIAILNEKKPLDKPDLLSYNLLQKKEEHTKFSIDSLKLSVAERYKYNGLKDKAETLFLELSGSKFPGVRSRAKAVLDSLIKDKRVEFYEEYPYEPITNLIKPILPLAIILAIVALIFRYFNRRENICLISVHCNDNDEQIAFRAAISITLDGMQPRRTQQAGSSVVPIGQNGILPHLEPDTPTGLDNLVTATVPESYLKLVMWIWRFGISPRHLITVFIEKGDTQVIVRSNLKIGGNIITQWNWSFPKDELFDKRMDIAYEALRHIQINS